MSATTPCRQTSVSQTHQDFCSCLILPHSTEPDNSVPRLWNHVHWLAAWNWVGLPAHLCPRPCTGEAMLSPVPLEGIQVQKSWLELGLEHDTVCWEPFYKFYLQIKATCKDGFRSASNSILRLKCLNRNNSQNVSPSACICSWWQENVTQLTSSSSIIFKLLCLLIKKSFGIWEDLFQKYIRTRKITTFKGKKEKSFNKGT